LSLDLGGTNFRVIFMELTETKEFMMDSKIYAIPQVDNFISYFLKLWETKIKILWR
jgi:hexokinase